VTEHETVQGFVSEQRRDLGAVQNMDSGLLLNPLDQVA